MGTLINTRYKYINNFLTKEEIKLLSTYCKIKHRLNSDSFDFRQNDNCDTSFYADPLIESLMVIKLGLMQRETGLELIPTYSYWRAYSMFSDLKKHKDRPACEISVSVMIGSDGTKWPIFMDGVEIELQAGDAVAYLGCEVEHWREEFKGDWHTQCFLHYVNKNGVNTEHELDKRPYVGMKK
jgi:hypothetical protein